MNSRKAWSFILVAAVTLFTLNLFAAGKLQIEKAYCGAQGSWLDVTQFLQQDVTDDSLSATIEQPFEEIGGDPAPGQGKTMLIDYRFNGQSYRVLLEEKYPIAFTVTLPSSEALAPGADARASAMMADISAHPAQMADISPGGAYRAKPQWQSSVKSSTPNRTHMRNDLAFWTSLIAITCGIAALFQIHQIKKQLRKARIAEPHAPPNGGPKTQPSDLVVREGPPSVS